MYSYNSSELVVQRRCSIKCSAEAKGFCFFPFRRFSNFFGSGENWRMLRKVARWNVSDCNVLGMVTRHFATKPKPKMKPIELKTPPEQTQTITRVIFDILKEHGPLTISETWDRVKEVGLRGLTSKRHMKIILRWMRERQKLRLICNHVGPHKQFLYTTWFTKHNPKPAKPAGRSAGPKLP